MERIHREMGKQGAVGSSLGEETMTYALQYYSRTKTLPMKKA